MSITIQSTYNTDYTEGFPGMVANGETSNRISRTIEDSAGIAFGKATFRGTGDHGVTATQALVGAGSANASNVGTSTITASPTVGAGAKIGRYSIVQLRTNATGELEVFDPDGILVAHGVVGTAITTVPGITTFTVTGAGTPTAGDAFYIDVTGNGFMGVTIADVGIVPLTVSGAVDTYPQYSTAGLLTEGVIYVTVAANVADGDAAYVTSAGAWTNVASGNIPMPAIFDQTVSSGGVCRLRVRRA